MTPLAAVLRDLRRAGYSTRLARSGHWHIRDRAGHLVAVTGSTPSDHRAVRNLRAHIRRLETP